LLLIWSKDARVRILDVNKLILWERLKKFKIKKFRQCALKKNQDPEIWITELEDLCMKVEELGSSITDNQFMFNILNNMSLTALITADHAIKRGIVSN
jgi:hypothetical protein